MTKENKKVEGKRISKKSFLERLPSKVPFAPIVRRPDYQLRKIKNRKLSKINATIIIALMLMGTIYILIGGFYYASQDENYAIVEHPITHEPSVIWMETFHDQTIFEGFAVAILIGIGSSGLYLVHIASQYAYTPTTVAKFLIIGIFLTLFAILAVTTLFYYKVGILKEWIDKIRAAYAA